MRSGKATIFAILAAALYAVSTPFSKLLLTKMGPSMLAALLYLGAGLGMAAVGAAKSRSEKRRGDESHENRLTRRELPYTLGMILLDIAAPILLMLGLTRATAANVSLLNNFEIVATSLLALWFFREKIGPRLWIAIGLITLSSLVLSLEDAGSFTFSIGSLFVLGACCCWGLENNCTRVLSSKDPLQIVVVKGFGSGLGALLVALWAGEHFSGFFFTLCALLLGFVAYGLSITFYVYAQRGLGAAKTSAYYAIAPFLGTALSLAICREAPRATYYIGLLLMLGGAYFATLDTLKQQPAKS